MLDLLAHPIGQSIILPFTVSMFCAFLIQFPLDGVKGAHWTVFGIAAGILAGYLVILDLPPFPPRSSSQKWFYIVLLTIPTSIVVNKNKTVTKILCWLLAVFVVGWLASPILTWRNPSVVLSVLVLILISLTTFKQFDTISDYRFHGFLILIFGAIGISIASGLGESASVAQLALAVATATAGACFASWRNFNFRFNQSSMYISMVPLLALVSQLVLFGGASIFAMLPLLSLLFIHRGITRFIPSQKGSVLAMGIISVVPLAITGLVAAHLESTYDAYSISPATSIAQRTIES